MLCGIPLAFKGSRSCVTSGVHEAIHIITIVWKWMFVSQFVHGLHIQMENKLKSHGRFIVEIGVAVRVMRIAHVQD